MIAALLRKSRQLAGDPVLRRWLLARALGKVNKPEGFTAHHPPYLATLDLGAPPVWDGRFSPLAAAPPEAPLPLDLAGFDLTADPTDAAALFDRSFADIEQYLALHRFAWIDDTGDPAWVAALWQAWRMRFGTPDGGWAWHPYTAAERLINLLAFIERHGMPEPCRETWDALCAHGPAIAARLEYFGPHYTGNHLANNGRGLFRLGTALDWQAAADLGGRILLEEAKRIFGPSGVLIEGSAHYHLLLAKNYADCARWAKNAGRAEAVALQAIADKAREAAGGLFLQGGLPLIGDISPDIPPAKLCPAFARTGADLSTDGWHRFEQGDWSLMLHAPPSGWPPMPGHGHQDLGSFELHWRGIPLIVDAGRGGYGESGEAALYRSAAVHNSLTFQGLDPRPANRPYYDDAFRRRTAGGLPCVERNQDALRLRFPMQDAEVERRFQISGASFLIADSVQGAGRRRIERRLAIPHPVEVKANRAVIQTPAGSLRLDAGASLKSSPLIRWLSYGRGETARLLLCAENATLPWQGVLKLEPL